MPAEEAAELVAEPLKLVLLQLGAPGVWGAKISVLPANR
jgi:hypothetical protein